MNNWGYYFIIVNGDCFLRLCASLGANVFLRGNCDYKFGYGDSVSRGGCRELTLRGICCGVPNFGSIFFITFFIAFCDYGGLWDSFNIFTRDGV